MSKYICDFEGSIYTNLAEICGKNKKNGFILIGVGTDYLRKVIQGMLWKIDVLSNATGDLKEAHDILTNPEFAQKQQKTKIKGCLCAILEEKDGFHGISLLQEIRADDNLSNLIVLIISGESGKDAVGHASEAGANGFITIGSGGVTAMTIESKLLKAINDRANPPAYVKLIKGGENCLEQNDLEKALAFFGEALKAYYKMAAAKADHFVADAMKKKSFTSSDKRANAERAIPKAREFRKKNENEKAIERFELALENLGASSILKEFRSNKSASLSRIFLLTGKTHEKMGRMDEAENFFSKAVTVNPISLKASLEMVKVCEKKGDKNGSIIHLKQVNHLSPRNPERQRKLGELCLNQGDTEEAQWAFNFAIKEDPESIRDVSQLCLNQENTSLASYFLKKAIFKSKTEGADSTVLQDIVDQYNELGRQLRQDNKFEQALEEYERALMVVSNDPRLVFNKGRALYEWGKKDAVKRQEAKNLFLRAAKLLREREEPDKELEEGLKRFLSRFDH